MSPGPTLGDRVLIERLAGNLLDNAVRYNLSRGSITVVTGTDNDASYIAVTNTGQVVPASAVASLFEPFTRLGGRVSNGHSVGLGLSIVTSVVNAHHGHLHAEALPTGGMKISVRLPKSTLGATPHDALAASAGDDAAPTGPGRNTLDPRSEEQQGKVRSRPR